MTESNQAGTDDIPVQSGGHSEVKSELIRVWRGVNERGKSHCKVGSLSTVASNAGGTFLIQRMPTGRTGKRGRTGNSSPLAKKEADDRG